MRGREEGREGGREGGEGTKLQCLWGDVQSTHMTGQFMDSTIFRKVGLFLRVALATTTYT